MNRILGLLLLLCPYLSNAQPLKTGERIPVISMAMSNYDKPTAFTTQFNGKLLLLDFWATWCGNCIKKFSMLDSMQRIHADSFQVLLVNSRSTGDTKEKLDRFFNRYKTSKGLRTILPTVLADTAYKSLFPHTSLPHYAWVDKQGNFITITGPDEVSPQNIALALQGQTGHLSGLALMETLDLKKPLFVQGNGGGGEQIIARSTFTSYIKGLRSLSHFKKKSASQYIGFTILNTSLLNFITRAWEVFEPANRIIINDSIFEKFVEKEGEERYANFYCYERITSPVTMEQLLLQMQRDITNQFQLTAKWEARPSDVYLLTVDTVLLKKYKTKCQTELNTLASPENKHLANGELAAVVHWLNNSLDRYVIQQQDVSFKLDLNVPSGVVADQPALLNWLRSIGIYLTPSIKNVERFVISKSSN